MSVAKTVDDYIETFPSDIQTVLRSLRAVARTALPDAEETISYGIPAYRVDGTDIVYFAGWQRHVSLYPVPVASGALETAMRPYRSGRGTLRFPLGEPLPMDLVEQIVALLVEQRRPG
jgi:uncharacterized protein YdhG (YjbR/CyaY superfamily)